MKINKNSEDCELKFYLKILDYFYDDTVSPEKKEIWNNQSIIQLMKLLVEGKHNRNFVTNALILILSLSERIPPDIYSNRGKNIKSISEKDKELILTELRNEFLPN